MRLTSRLIADYTELANHQLDAIPIRTEEDFLAVREALLSITEPSEKHTVPDSLRDRVKSLQEMINSPELYVQDEENYPEFQNIMLLRIAAKIREIDTLTPHARSNYIQSQEGMREEASRNQTLMASRRAPLESVISEREWLLQEQERFQREAPSTPPAVQLSFQQVFENFCRAQIASLINQISERQRQRTPPQIQELLAMQILLCQLQLLIDQLTPRSR